MYIIFNLVSASSVISNTAETTFTPILLPAITRTLLLLTFGTTTIKYKKKQELLVSSAIMY